MSHFKSKEKTPRVRCRGLVHAQGGLPLGPMALAYQSRIISVPCYFIQVEDDICVYAHNVITLNVAVETCLRILFKMVDSVSMFNSQAKAVYFF